MKKILILAIATCALWGCSKDKTDKAEYVVFGKFYGMCLDNCFQVYRIDDKQLAADDSVQRYGSNYTFAPTRTLSAAAYADAKPVLTSVPQDLIKGGSKTYGSPDSHDQGGVYVQVRRNGQTITAILDNDETPDQSASIREYKRLLHSVAEKLE